MPAKRSGSTCCSKVGTCPRRYPCGLPCGHRASDRPAAEGRAAPRHARAPARPTQQQGRLQHSLHPPRCEPDRPVVAGRARSERRSSHAEALERDVRAPGGTRPLRQRSRDSGRSDRTPSRPGPQHRARSPRREPKAEPAAAHHEPSAGARVRMSGRGSALRRHASASWRVAGCPSEPTEATAGSWHHVAATGPHVEDRDGRRRQAFAKPEGAHANGLFPSLSSTRAWLLREATSGNHPWPVLLTRAFGRPLSIRGVSIPRFCGLPRSGSGDVPARHWLCECRPPCRRTEGVGEVLRRSVDRQGVRRVARTGMSRARARARSCLDEAVHR